MRRLGGVAGLHMLLSGRAVWLVDRTAAQTTASATGGSRTVTMKPSLFQPQS